MSRNKILQAIAFTEILIGAVTLIATIISFISSTSTKTPNVLIFVLLTASISTLIGIGILRVQRIAYDLLIYFSSIIILSKILIFTNIISLNGSLETSIPSYFKNIVSIAYHTFVIFYLKKENIKKIFVR